MRLGVTELESRETPAAVLLASAGGTVYERVGGEWEYRARAFEADVPSTLARVGDSVFVGAGVGGGPRVVEYGRGWQQLDSFFLGDPDSRSGVSVLGFERPSLAIRGPTPQIQAYIDRIPPLSVDLSGVSIRVLPHAQWDAGPALAYYSPQSATSGIITLHEKAPGAVIHEVWHAVGHLLHNDLSEGFAEAGTRWVGGEPNPFFDALVAT